MARYHLFVMISKAWVQLATIEAPTPAEALRRAISGLAEEHYGRPIKLEPDLPPNDSDNSQENAN